MAACAVTVGATQGVIYLRHEYGFMQPLLQQKIDARGETGLLGRSLLGHHGTDFDIEIFMGAGSYVCGEESALLESLEGQCGIPRSRPRAVCGDGPLSSTTWSRCATRPPLSSTGRPFSPTTAQRLARHRSDAPGSTAS
ncbi:MAG: hypothetical protein AB8G17_13965 [Gammaproteobacteria bacterium]